MFDVKNYCFWVLEFITMKKIFTFGCSALTLFLISRLFYTVVVLKPTTTYKEEKGLETIDIPEILICLDPGFDINVLKVYGYERGFDYYKGDIPKYYKDYFNGNIPKGLFYGWNGENDVQMSSIEILEESLLIKKNASIGGRFFSNNRKTGVSATVRNLVYPFGRCFSFAAPSIELEKHTNLVQNEFIVTFDLKILRILDIPIKVFIMDTINSIRFYPDEENMVGDTIKVDPRTSDLLIYKTHIFRSKNIEGDPSLECADYTKDNSYYDCLQEELKQNFNKMIGCQPPHLFPDSNNICNKRFNSSRNERKARTLLRDLLMHNYKFECKTSCETNRYSTKLIHREVQNRNFTQLNIIFDKTVAVVHTKLIHNLEETLRGLGGQISVGRTLLWVLLSIVAVPQVTFN